MTHKTFFLATAAISIIFLSLMAGCPSEGQRISTFSRQTPANMASRQFSKASLKTVQTISDRIFRNYFKVDPQRSSNNVWISRPQEMQKPSQPTQLRDTITVFPARSQNVAELRIEQKGPNILAMCRVQIQRLDTAQRAAFSDHRGDDRPSDTPIDRLGATSVHKQEKWVNAGRDRKTEQMILDAIQKQIESARK